MSIRELQLPTFMCKNALRATDVQNSHMSQQEIRPTQSPQKVHFRCSTFADRAADRAALFPPIKARRGFACDIPNSRRVTARAVRPPKVRRVFTFEVQSRGLLSIMKIRTASQGAIQRTQSPQTVCQSTVFGIRVPPQRECALERHQPGPPRGASLRSRNAFQDSTKSRLYVNTMNNAPDRSEDFDLTP